MASSIFPVQVDAAVTEVIVKFVDSLGVPDEERSIMLEYITLAAQRNTKAKLAQDLEELVSAKNLIPPFLASIEEVVISKQRSREEKQSAAPAPPSSNTVPHERRSERRDEAAPSRRIEERGQDRPRDDGRDSHRRDERRRSRSPPRRSRSPLRRNEARGRSNEGDRHLGRTRMDEEDDNRAPSNRRDSPPRATAVDRPAKRQRDDLGTFVIHRNFDEDGEGVKVEKASESEPNAKRARLGSAEPQTASALDRLNAKLKQKSQSPPKETADEAPTTFTITLDQVAQNAVKQVPQIASKKIAVKSAMQEALRSTKKPSESTDEAPAHDDTHVVVAAQQVPKCVFFPNCTKADCPFFHPTEPCKKFPSCPFGDKCRYIHPVIDCKFGLKCTRPNCNYAHPKKTEVPCKFGAACTNPKCPFFHAKETKEPCPSGFACDRKEICPFKHPKTECRFKEQCRNKERCAFSHAQPCANGADCKVVDCQSAHPAPKAPHRENPAAEDQAIRSLSTSLPKTPPQSE